MSRVSGALTLSDWRTGGPKECMTTRVTIEATASALEGESESLSGKVDAAEEQISRMANALQSPELAGEGYAAIRSVARDLAVPAAKAYYVAFDAMNSACTADAQAVRGLPQSSSGVCDTDEFQKKIEAVQSDIEETQRRITQNRANAGGTSTNGSSGSSSGGTNTSQDTTANVNTQVDEALLESEKTEKQGYEDDLKKAQEYDEASASTYSSAQDAVSTMKSAADSVSSYLAGNGYGDTSWAAGVDDAYSTVFERRVEECERSIYHDGGIDRGELSKLLGGDDLTPSEAEALARVWNEHSDEDGVAEAFAEAGSKDGQMTGAYAAFVTQELADVYNTNMQGADPSDQASEGQKKQTLQVMDDAINKLFPSIGATGASYKVSVLLPNGVLYTREHSASGDVGGDGPLSTEIKKDASGRPVPGSLTFDLTGDDSAGPVFVNEDGQAWTGIETKGSVGDGIEGESRVLFVWDPVHGYSAARAEATVKRDTGSTSASVTDKETLEWGVKQPETGVQLDGVLMPSASKSPAPSTHTNAVQLPDAQTVGEGVAAAAVTAVVAYVAFKVAKALIGFAVAGPPGAVVGAALP